MVIITFLFTLSLSHTPSINGTRYSTHPLVPLLRQAKSKRRIHNSIPLLTSLRLPIRRNRTKHSARHNYPHPLSQQLGVIIVLLPILQITRCALMAPSRTIPTMTRARHTIRADSGGRTTRIPALALPTPTPRTTGMTPQPPLLLKVAPPLHGDLTAVEFAVALVAAFARAALLARRLPRVAPAEVVEVPVGVRGQDEVPDGEGEEVDEHPEDVGDAVGGDDDEGAGQAEDEGQKDEGDKGGGGVGDGGFDAEGAWEGC